MSLALLAIKLTLAPSLVAAATAVARRLGHRAGGLVGGLPVVAAPIVLIYALQHGQAYAARAAQGTVLGIVSLVAFSLTYATVARRARWPAAVAAGWAAFLTATALFALQPLPLAVSGVLTFAVVVVASRSPALKRPMRADAHGRDLMLWRLLATVAMVLALTSASGSLSPWLSGLLAPFPVITAVLASFTHAQSGPDATAELLAGLVPGLASFALFFVALAIALPRVGTAAAFALATGAALASHAAIAFSSAPRRPSESSPAPPRRA